MNRGELRTAVLDALNRKDLSAVANTWITSATTRINTMLRHRQQMTHFTGVVTAGTFALPANFIEAHSVAVNTTGGAARGPLQYVPPADLSTMAESAAYNGANCTPAWFTVHGLNMELAPYRTGTYNLDMWYFAKLAQFVTDTDTNFFLTDYPHVYLNACMAFGHRFMLEMDAAMGYEQLFAAEVLGINDAEENARIGRGPLIVRPTRRVGGRNS